MIGLGLFTETLKKSKRVQTGIEGRRTGNSLHAARLPIMMSLAALLARK